MALSYFSQPAVMLAVVSAGVFFLTGLLTGAWKYHHIHRSENAQAPVYVDIAHRSSLLYSFAALLVAVFANLSAWDDAVDLYATAAQVSFFGLAIGGYIVHGLLQDTDNQLRRPHRVGKTDLPKGSLETFMWALMLAEIGGFLVLFSGTLRTLGLV